MCALYARKNCIGFMVILGKDERAAFEQDKESYAQEVRAAYENAQTFYDGKWIMFQPTDTSLFHDFMRLLAIKRKPNKK